MRTLNENQPAVAWYQMPAIEDDGRKRRHQDDSQIPGNQEERRQPKVLGRWPAKPKVLQRRPQAAQGDDDAGADRKVDGQRRQQA